MTGRPSSVVLPDAEGRGQHNTPGLSCHRRTNILVLSCKKTCYICYKYIIFFKQIKISFRIYSPINNFILIINASSYLTNRRMILLCRIFAREGDITVSGGQ